METPIPDDPMNLTDDEIRVKIAEICGWRYPGSSYLKLESWDRWIPPKGATSKKVPNYPASVDAALTLCDRLRSEGWKVEILGRDDWMCIFSKGGKWDSERDSSLARAICLAFLKVKDSVASSP